MSDTSLVVHIAACSRLPLGSVRGGEVDSLSTTEATLPLVQREGSLLAMGEVGVVTQDGAASLVTQNVDDWYGGQDALTSLTYEGAHDLAGAMQAEEEDSDDDVQL